MSQNTIKRFDGIYRATINAVVRTWQNSPWRRPVLILVILGTIFGSSAFFYGNPEPASALVQPAGRLYYGDQTNSAMRFQTNTFDFTFNGESSFTHGASASLIAHTVVKTAPTRDEVMVGQLKVDGQLHVIRGINGYDVNTDYSLAWTNSGTTGTQTCAGTTEADCTRAFDITYERLSGRSMVVYADTTNQKLYYCYFDGTNWGPVSNCAPTNGSNDITLSSNGRPTFVSLKAKGGTNEILMGVSIDVSGTHEVEAYRWDGDSWENQLVATDTTDAATTGLESGVIFDVEWESNSGDGMVVWASSAGNGATVYRLFTGGSWGSDQTGPTSVGSNGTPHTVQLEADPVSNRIGYVYTDSLNDSAPGVWKANGTTAGWTMGNEDAGLEATEPGVVFADIKWERFTSTLMWVAQTGGTSVDTEYQTATCDGSGCTFSSIDTTIPTAGSDDGNFVRLADSPNSDDIMFLWSHHDRDLYAQHWDGSAWEAAASASLEADLSPGTADNTNFHGMSAAFTYIPYNPWQRNWRFFDDETVNEPSTGLNGAAENATPTGVDPEEFIRLRINVFNPQPQAQTDARKKLQYASGCDPNSSETACTWSDVGDTSETTAVWRYATSGETCSNCSDNTTFATNRLTGSTQTGWYTSDKDAAGGTNMDHNANAIVELDFPLKAEDVAASTTYYFRLYDVDQDRPVRREQDNDGSNDCASATCTYPSLTTAAPTVTLSGGCFTDETEGTACTDDGSNQIKVAVNGTLDSGVDTVVDGSWSLNIATTLAANDILVVFIDGEATETEEATTVVKYDGSGNITNVKLYQSQLVIGTDSGSTNTDQTITAADLNTAGNGYENSDDEDVLYDYTAGADIIVDAEGNKSEQLYVMNGDTYRPASGGGSDTTTFNLEIDTGATITADSNAFAVGGSWNNGGTFTANTSTVTFDTSASGRTLSGTMTGSTGKFHNIVFNGGDGSTADDFEIQAAIEAANDFTLTAGNIDTNNNNVTVTRDFTLTSALNTDFAAGSSTIAISRHFNDSAGTIFIEDTSTVQMNGTGTVTYGNGGDFHNLSVGYTSNTTTFSNNNWDIYGTLTFNGGTVTGGGSYISLRRSSAGSSVTFASATTINGTQTLYHVAEGGSSYTYTITGGNYGSWSVVPHAAVNSVTYSLGGNLTSTGFVRLEANDAVTGSAFNTSGSNYSITASYLLIAPCAPTRTGSWVVDFNDSVIALSSTASSLYVGTNCGSHTLDLDTSDVTVNGSVSFVDGTGTIAITPGSSDFTFAPTASQTETYTPNGQSLWNMIINGANAAATIQPTAAVDVNNNFTITAGTYDTVSGSNYALTVGGNYSNSGTFTARAATVTFDATDTGNTVQGTLSGSSAFYNLTFNGSGGEWTNSAALEIANDLTMTAGTLAGTNNVTVVGHTQGTSGVINRTGGTFKQGATVSKNFGTTSGTTAWTFSDLTFANDLGICTGITYTTQTGGTGGITVSGVLRIGESGDGSGCTTTLNAGNRTWTLSGTGGDPFQLLASPAGTLTASTSTFTYTGNNGAGNTTVQVATYYNLDINNNSETFVTEGNTTASNDLTVTNGVLDTTGSNHSLTVTRDLILSNTAGVGLTANGSTIAVSRHFTDSGDKYTMGTSTLTMNGTGTFTVANSSLFYILNLGYSTFTTTLSGNNFGVNNQLTFNGGTVDSPSSYIEANCAGTCTPVVFNSATSLTGTRSIYFRQTSTTGTLTVAGANFGSWALRLFTTSASATAATFNLGGGLTTTNTLLLEAAVGSTGNIFNTQNNSLTALTLSAGDESRTASWTINLGSSTVSLNGTVDSLRVASNGGSHTLNMGTSSVTVSGNVLFANGTGTIAVDDGTSTLTWVNTSGTATYAPNSQTLYNVTLNGSGGSVQPNAAAIIANDLTMTAGTLSGTQNITVNGTVQGTAGIINLTGGTFNQRVTANENFGTTSGSTAWTFYNLKFSNASVLDNWWTITTQTGGTGGITISNILQVGDTIDSDSIILTAGNRTWTLSGTTGDPFQVQTATAGFDAVTPGTSTFTYTGNNAGGNTTVERNPLGVGYYNLDINNSSETFVLEGNTTVGNDLTVTNGVLSTTGSNFSLTVTRDLVLANTTGVALTANGSTITVSRNWSDPGNKFTEGTSSTVILNGTGTIDEAGQFYALSIAYSTKTSTFLQNAIIAGGLTFNGGVATSSTTQTHSVTCTSVCTPVTFSSPTTLDESGGGTSTLVFQQNGSATLTVTGANYGTWNVSFRANGTGLTSPTVQLGGNVSTTGSATIRVNATGTTTGATFNTQNNSLTATTLQMGTTTATNSWTNNFGSSTITLTGTSNNGLAADAGNHTWNMQTSNWSIAGNLALASGASTITMNAGSSVVTFAMATTSRTLTSGNQSFYDVVVNSSTASRTLTLQDNFRTTRHFTITSGTFDVNSTGNYSVTIGGNYTNNSTFTARNGSVTFDGSSSQTLSGTLTGSSAFYNLTVTNSSGTNASDCERTGFVPSIDFDAAATVTNNTVFTTASSRIEFNSGSTYTLTNINWNGQAVGTRLYFRNSAVSGSWNLNVSGTQTAVSYVNVSRSNASSGNTIVASDGTNLDCGNNVNWNFTSPDAPSDLAQKKTNDTVIATGGWTNETSVKFTATASDTDSSDTLYLCVEKDLLGTGFSNTEDLCGTGVAYIGTPVTVTVTISGITDASEYHWQARVKDQGGLYGSWLSYGGNAESARDFGVDTTACTYAGTIYDGLVEDVDAAFNDGSLEELTANWDAFSCGASGLLRYDVSIGTTAGGTDILTWTNNGANEDTTQAGLNLHTNQRYYVNVRAIDNASNTSSVHSSNGQDVLPTISLTLGSTTITFSNLNDGNNRTDSKTLNLTTSTNAYGGYVIRQYATGVLTAGSFTIPMFQGGTYASPGSWPGGFCTGGSNCGYGYTSNDTTIQGSNKFSSGTLYASFATAAFGDIVADHTDAVTGATGPVTNQAFTITHKVAVDALQAAKNYQTEVLYIVTGTF
jgi:hypothetical protein